MGHAVERRRLLFAVAIALQASMADGQELEPRAYTNTPIGLDFLIAAYAYSEGGATPDPTVPLTDVEAKFNSGTLAYARSLDFFGKSAKFDVVVPYGRFSGSAAFAGQPHERDVAGFGSPRFRVSVNFYGAPALTMAEFASYRQDLILGASVYVWAPWGQYDPSKLINVGTNRWAYKAELGASKAVGAWTFELVPAVTFFADNTDFLGGRTRSQDPLYSIQGHVIHSFHSGVWMAFDATWFAGGQTSVGGVVNRDRESNSRAGLTLVTPVDRHNSIKLFASRGVSTRIGSSFDTFGVAWQYRWGD